VLQVEYVGNNTGDQRTLGDERCYSLTQDAAKGLGSCRQDTKSDAREAKGERRRGENQVTHNILGTSDFPAIALWYSSLRHLCSIPDISLPLSLPLTSFQTLCSLSRRMSSKTLAIPNRLFVFFHWLLCTPIMVISECLSFSICVQSTALSTVHCCSCPCPLQYPLFPTQLTLLLLPWTLETTSSS
jgi:hypothetical protein